MSPAVSRWRRRPVWWLLGGLLLTAWFGRLCWRDELRERDLRARSAVVTAQVDPTWDGRSLVPVRYTDPGDGTPRRAIVGFGDHVPPDDATEVRIRTTGGPEAEVGPEPYGRPSRWADLLWVALPSVGGSALWCALRHRRVRRSGRLARSDGPSYRMQGVPLPGRVFGRRWRLALHEVDARPGDPAVCVVPVIGQPLRDGPRTVEVKGRPRPGGEVVVRELAGRRWWPTGRVMVGARSTFDAEASPSPMRTDRGPIPAGAIAMAGIAFGLLVLGVVGYGAMAATEARAEVHEAEVVAGEGPGAVTVELAWAGVRRTAQVDAPGPVEVGGTVDVRVDPDDPGRIWADGDDTPDDRVPNWAVAALTAAMALGGVAVAACRSPRAGIGDRLRSAVDDAPAAGRFRLVDGTLWYVPDGPSATVDPSLGFEPSGLVVVRPDTLALWSWDRHVGRDPSPHRWYAACDGRRLSLVAPHALVVLDAPDGAAVVDLVEAVVRTPGVQERLADRSWLEDLLAAIADAGARTGRAGPTITGDGGAAPDG